MLKRYRCEILKQPIDAAAFGRLCVETMKDLQEAIGLQPQPPSGGCVLKHQAIAQQPLAKKQPPSGGCVLKQAQQLALR